MPTITFSGFSFFITNLVFKYEYLVNIHHNINEMGSHLTNQVNEIEQQICTSLNRQYNVVHSIQQLFTKWFIDAWIERNSTGEELKINDYIYDNSRKHTCLVSLHNRIRENKTIEGLEDC